jgi:anaerobic ribonucleoside-triphosphate reductase activating protein
MLKLVKRIRAECPGKDIWVWTGYKLDELNAQQMEVVDLINVLVDGKFVQDLKDPALIWRGSSNQVVRPFYLPSLLHSFNALGSNQFISHPD